MKERWKKIRDFPNYEVSDRGRVRNAHFNRMLRQKVGDRGYVRLALYHNGESKRFTLQSLVAMVFLGKQPKDTVIRFKDGNPRNCDVLNLQYVPWSDWERPHGSDHYGAKLTESDVRSMRCAYTKGNTTMQKLGDKYGISRSMVSQIVKRQAWKHVR